MPGVNIIATRTTDIYQNPREKAQIANYNHGELFICIHADAVLLKTGSRIIGPHTVTTHIHAVPTIHDYKLPTESKGTSS